MVQFVAGAVGPESLHGPVRVVTGIVYLVVAAGLVFQHRRRLVGLARDGFRAPYAQLQEES